MVSPPSGLVDRCLLVGFAGTRADDVLRRRVADGLAGVVLFGRNIHSAEQVAELTATLRAEREDVIVAIDEEGGQVTRLEADHGSSYPGNAALGHLDDVSATENAFAAMGAELAAAGVTLDLAPVADVNVDPANPVIGVRSFGADPVLVARHVAASVRGLHRAGVGACAKHFPGHGDTSVDSHVDLPVVRHDLDRLRAVELAPFRAAIAAGVDAIMTAHVVFPALDDRPATVSRRILVDLLRREQGFTGAVITDALEMQAVADTMGVAEGAVASLLAGADLLCTGMHERADTQARDGLLAALQDGRLPLDRLEQAAGRASALAAATGRLHGSADPGTRPDRELGRRIAEEALVAHDPSGVLPLSGGVPTVVEIETQRSAGVGGGAARVCGAVAAVRTGAQGHVVRRGGPLPAIGPGPLLVACRDLVREPWQLDVVSALTAGRRDAAVLLTGLADDARELPAGTTSVCCHGAGRAGVEAAVAAVLGSRPR